MKIVARIFGHKHKMLNTLKYHPLNTQMQMCEEMKNSETQVLFHTDFRWQPRGKTPMI